MKKYHLITIDPDCGEDDKDDLKTLREVVSCAKNYLKEYRQVLVFSNHSLIRVFDRNNTSGRKPYPFELNDRHQY